MIFTPKISGVHINFTDPSAKLWWHNKVDLALSSMGIDGWKIDMGADSVSHPVDTLPTLSACDCRPYKGGTAAETCTMANAGAATWCIGVHG